MNATRTNYHRQPARNAYWQSVRDERDARNEALGNALKAYNAARKEWEANGKQGPQPSLKNFETQ